MSKRYIDYEVRLEGFQPLRGSLKIAQNESIPSIREKIQKQTGYRENTLLVQQPHGPFLHQSTKIVILRQMKQKQKERVSNRGYQEGSIYFEEQSIIQRSVSQQFMYREPQMPPRVVGHIKRSYKIFSCMSSNRVMVLNFENLKFCKSESEEDQQNAERTIELKSIKQVSSYRKQNLYFLRLVTNEGEKIDCKFINKEICKEWITNFHKALEYTDYLSQKKNYSRAQSYRNFVKGLEDKDKDKKIVRLEDNMESVQLLQRQPDKQQEKQEKSQGKKQSNTIIKSKQKIIRLADFKVTHEIGKGAFSTVYKAERNGKIYALKQINKDKLIYENQLKYAITELNILKKSSNKCPFIIPLYYAFQTEDYLYLAMKYLPFGTLKSLVEKRGKLTVKQATNIVCQLIVAIEFLHKSNVLYRDMKPQNIMLTQEGHLYLIDFGLSIQLNEAEQFAESFVGTPLYLAPERLQGSGKINYKADIYGVGCIFYLMLHGHAPFQAQSLASIIYNIKNGELKMREDLDDMVQDFLKKTLEINADKRLNHMSSHPLFDKVDWNRVGRRQAQILSLQMKASSQFCGSNGTGDKDYTEQNYPNKKINDWNYIDLMESANEK